MEPPRTRYVRSGDVNIAYQVVGEGPVDLLFVPGWFSHLDAFWEMPGTRDFFAALARFSRLILYDKRGTGLSDPVTSAGSYADRHDDLLAVIDAAGAERPVICGLSEGGYVATLFAAQWPERVQSLILLNAPTTTDMVSDMRNWRDTIAQQWGEGALFEIFVPELADSPATREWWARMQRLSASRGIALDYYDEMLSIDSTPALPAISAPTLVLHGSLDRVISAESAHTLAAGIAGATRQELRCGHIPWITGGREVVRAIEQFVTGAEPAAPTERRLATVLFTDIVDSTQQASTLGDGEWRAVLDRHDEVVRTQIERFGGREVKATGDGFLAVFPGPAEAIECALAVRHDVAELGIGTRAGVHMGQCELRGGDVAGIAVHIGARVAALAEQGEILVSRTVRDLVAGSDIALEDRGEHVLKGVPEPWRVYAVR